MFEFFKDMYLELKGIDSAAAAEERRRQEAEKQKRRFIFSGSAKVLTFVVGILYLLIAGILIALMVETGSLSIDKIVCNAFLILCDLATLICLAVGKKKTEIAALILIGVFMLMMYISVFYL